MIRRFFVVMPIVLGAIGCRSPWPTIWLPDTVLCNNLMKGQGRQGTIGWAR